MLYYDDKFYKIYPGIWTQNCAVLENTTKNGYY